MILDSSALVALLLDEPSAPALLDALDGAEHVGVSAATLVEAGIVLEARLGALGGDRLRRLLELLQAEILPFEEGQWGFAVDGWRKFGKGNHPARLNFGDCISYGAARYYDQPLLCVGDDFPQTDLELVALGDPVSR